MPIVLKSEGKILNCLNLLYDSQGNRRLASDSQGHIQTSDGDVKTWTFYQTWVTTGDTAYRVKGVLAMHDLMSYFLSSTLPIPQTYLCKIEAVDSGNNKNGIK